MKTTITTRTLTAEEKSKMRKSHWFILPMVLFFALILWAINIIGAVPNPVIYAVYTIAVLALLATLVKQFKLEKELIASEVEVVNGVIAEKKKFGKSRRRGINDRTSTFSPDHTFLFIIDEQEYYVKPTDYGKYEVGDMVELVWFPKSKYMLSVDKIHI
jgi:hypothetical protein